MVWRRSIVVGVFCLMLAACGWHLRGLHNPISYRNLPAVAIDGGNRQLRQLLIDGLENSQVTVSKIAKTHLHILSERWNEHTVAVDSQGRQAAIELTYHLTWRLEQQGKAITPTRDIRLISNVNQNPLNAVAASDELSLSKRNMIRNASWQLQRQLQRVTQNQDLSAPLPEQTKQLDHATQH